jgi:L-asparaginase II
VEPLTVLATRGDVVEARHVVHAVAVRDGAVVLEAGDPGLVCFLRSSAKPLQALAAVRARPT